MKSMLMIAQIISAVGVIGLVLVQQGKGADMGAAFGSGSSGSIFGSSGSSNFLSKTTGFLAAIFFVCTLLISYVGSKPSVDAGVLSKPGIVVPGDKPDAKSTEVKPAEISKESEKSGSAVPK